MKKILLTLFFAGFALSQAQAATTINAAHKFAYAANAGWINAEADGANGAVIGEFFSSGYMYGANIGWIHLGDGTPDNSTAYSNTTSTDYGVNTTPAGELRGYAYGANVGWINFEVLGDPKVDLLTGIMSGYAYSANMGWISLSNAFAYVQTDTLATGPDTDADQLPDAYELIQTNTLVTLSGLGGADADGDGSSDSDEFIAGTDPLDSGDLLAINEEDMDATNTVINVTWASVPTRLYELEENTTSLTSTNWLDSGLGTISPDVGVETTRAIPVGSSDRTYYRVKAIKPLAP